MKKSNVNKAYKLLVSKGIKVEEVAGSVIIKYNKDSEPTRLKSGRELYMVNLETKATITYKGNSSLFTYGISARDSYRVIVNSGFISYEKIREYKSKDYALYIDPIESYLWIGDGYKFNAFIPKNKVKLESILSYNNKVWLFKNLLDNYLEILECYESNIDEFLEALGYEDLPYKKYKNIKKGIELEYNSFSNLNIPIDTLNHLKNELEKIGYE
jgi:hypothetical protein